MKPKPTLKIIIYKEIQIILKLRQYDILDHE